MKAFLLAAGKGTRLAPLTDRVPKCLMPIHGKPLLEIWIDLFQKHGIHDILINTHHHAGQVEAFVSGLGKRRNAGIRLFHEPALLGSGGTVLANRAFVAGEEHFFIAYADNLTDLNLGRMADFHARTCGAGGCLTMGVRRVPDTSGCGVAVLDETGKILSFLEKPKNPPRDAMVNCGVYVASMDIFDRLPERMGEDAGERRGVIDFGRHIFPFLAGSMHGYPVRERLIDIGTPESYRRALAQWGPEAV
ncbi:Nucleotidyl transferase [Candidatus Desulfarcum epimagneticum]|uniref:Nucleotidyl transferase n=1 Tax=uncultured Desulfobacteraceae bacterium TaxID=218296 RepID=A0A484HJ53_9BACT|nr:Nucleotidyl transferase [uncultured Desulfobacteraceae bacterium]